MLSTREKRSKAKKIAIYIFTIIFSIATLLITFGKSLGIPDWYDVFTFFKIYPDTKDKLSVCFFSVGYADAIYIHEGDTDILIDSGSENSIKEISAYLDRYHRTHLDAVFVSHPDSDHIGGMSGVLNTYDTDTLYMYDPALGNEPTSSKYKLLKETIEENDISVSYLEAEDTLTFGDIYFEVLSPSEPYNNTNDNSLVLRMTYGSNTFLFTGDISEKVEKDLLNSDVELKSDVLKVSHHGSRSSSSSNFLEAVDPEYSIISADNYQISLPHYSTLFRLDRFSEVYITSEDDNILVTSDGENLSVTTHV